MSMVRDTRFHVCVNQIDVHPRYRSWQACVTIQGGS